MILRSIPKKIKFLIIKNNITFTKTYSIKILYNKNLLSRKTISKPKILLTSVHKKNSDSVKAYFLIELI